jgi:flagellar L-ring protein precursor FlgH
MQSAVHHRRLPRCALVTNRIGRAARILSAAAAALPLGACLHIEGRPPTGFDPPRPSPYAAVAPTIGPVPPSAGAIWSAARYTGLAEDDRARRIGDLVTIVLTEATTATKSATATTARKTALSLTLPKAKPFSSLPVGLFTGGTDNSFAGQGGATQSNQLKGEITVAVADVQPGGTLVVRGQKVVRLNRGDEFVNISGLVRPQDLGPDNRVLSTRVADARITYSGVGELAAQSRQGWAQRLLNFFTPF